MEIRSFEVDYDSDNRRRVLFTRDRGRIVEFVVQFETYLDGKWKPVIRYDCSHGTPHRDVYDRRGRRVRIHEALRVSPTNEEALTFAVQDLNERWQRYLYQFIRGT